MVRVALGEQSVELRPVEPITSPLHAGNWSGSRCVLFVVVSQGPGDPGRAKGIVPMPVIVPPPHPRQPASSSPGPTSRRCQNFAPDRHAPWTGDPLPEFEHHVGVGGARGACTAGRLHPFRRADRVVVLGRVRGARLRRRRAREGPRGGVAARPTAPRANPAPAPGCSRCPGCSTASLAPGDAVDRAARAPKFRRSPTPAGIDSPRSSPTPPRAAPAASSPISNCSTVAAPAPRTASGARRTPAWPTCRCTS